LIREGLDDYDYIFCLETLLERKKLNEKEKREGELLLKEVSDLIKDFWNYEMDYTKYENIRIKVGNFLEKFYD
jgi:tRNA A22 N-methylase